MTTIDFRSVKMSQVPEASATTTTESLWDGLLYPGEITLLTSQWKTGKTTLITGLLRQMEHGGEFLGRALRPGKALVVSEESHAMWADRLRKLPVGGHVELLIRPFPGRPSIDGWNALITHAVEMRRRDELDLLVIDPLIMFLPGRTESDAPTLVNMLQPLHRLAVEKAAILLLHHPRKKPSEPGQSARGSGALPSFADIVLELNRYSKLKTDFCRRRIVSLSRKLETPDQLAFEWNPATGEFTAIGDLFFRQYEDNWAQVLLILQNRRQAATHNDLLADWPVDQEKPSSAALYRWLERAFHEKRVRREGDGTRDRPWRYRLKNQNDELRDQFPPLQFAPL